MFNKLKDVEERYNFLTEEISKPEVIDDQNNWKKLMKERADIEEIVNKYREFKQVRTDIDMMSISKVLSNIPIEFEEGIKLLPESISFMEMENPNS